MIIVGMTREHELWDETAGFAENCSWSSGRRLAERMKAGGFSDWERIFAAVQDGKIAGFCAFEYKGNVPKRFDLHPFINTVFVDESFRGQRVSQRLIDAALRYAKQLGYHKVYLKSEHRGLYEKYGFRKIAEFEPESGAADQLFETEI